MWYAGYCDIPANTRSWVKGGLMLDQRLRRWANIKLTLVQLFLFAGTYFSKAGVLWGNGVGGGWFKRRVLERGYSSFF